jgi:NTE family protein
MAIPGLFKPATWRDLKLVDGGMMNNLPVDVVRRMGADIVIAVDLQQRQQVVRQEKQNPLSGLTDLLGVGGMVDWVLNRPDIKKYNENKASADIYIQPPLPDYEASSFSRAAVERMIAIGENAAKGKWEELKKVAAQGQP